QVVAALHPEVQVRAVTTRARVALDPEVKPPALAATRVPEVSPAQEAQRMLNAPLTTPFASSWRKRLSIATRLTAPEPRSQTPSVERTAWFDALRSMVMENSSWMVQTTMWTCQPDSSRHLLTPPLKCGSFGRAPPSGKSCLNLA